MSTCSPCPCPDHERGSCAAGGVQCWEGKAFQKCSSSSLWSPWLHSETAGKCLTKCLLFLAFLGRPEVDTCFTGLISLNVLPRTTLQCRWWEMFSRKFFVERCHLLTLNYLYFSTITMNAAQTSASGTQMKKHKEKKINSNNNKANQRCSWAKINPNPRCLPAKPIPTLSSSNLNQAVKPLLCDHIQPWEITPFPGWGAPWEHPQTGILWATPVFWAANWSKALSDLSSPSLQHCSQNQQLAWAKTMTSRDHLKTFTEGKCSKPWQEIKSWGLVHREPVKLQGKNAATAVPTMGKMCVSPGSPACSRWGDLCWSSPSPTAQTMLGRAPGLPGHWARLCWTPAVLLTCSIATSVSRGWLCKSV